MIFGFCLDRLAAGCTPALVQASQTNNIEHAQLRREETELPTATSVCARQPHISLTHALLEYTHTMAHLLDTPRTEVGDLTRFTTNDPSFSMEETFHAPADRDNLFKQMSGARTPRNNLASRRNQNAKNEFTPMLKSATANRTRQVNGLLDGKLTTPAAMKPGFQVGNTPLPEATMYDVESSSFADSAGDRTEMPNLSASDMSTPMALPRRAEGEMDGGNGNVLTLREQEAVRILRYPARSRGVQRDSLLTPLAASGAN